MLKSYFISTFRRLKRDKFFSILNLVGLTVGVTSFILLALYVKNELSVDQFHSKKDQIYIIAENVNGGKDKWARYRTSHAARMQDRIPELSQMAMLSQLGFDDLIKANDRSFYVENVYMSNNDFFEIFDFPIKQGNVELNQENKAVITESLARQYFNDESPIGKVIEVDGTGSFEITAIAVDPPANSRIQFKLLLSNLSELKEAAADFAESGGSIVSAYILLPENVSIESVQAKVDKLMLDEWPKSALKFDEEGNFEQKMYFFPFSDIHLKSGFTFSLFPVNDIRYIYLFGSIACLILMIACLNYVNLITARSIKKMKEIGLRKVFGANRKQILRQNIFESCVYTFISVLLAFALAERLLPYYNNLIDRQLSLSYFSLEFFVFVIGLTLIVGLASGIYPALRLSGFKTINALHGNSKVKERSGVRRGLVFTQFLVAQSLIVATVIIQSQLSYLQNKDLGYDRENALFIKTYGELGDRTSVFKDEVARISGVKEVSLTTNIIDHNGITFGKVSEFNGEEESSEEDFFFSNSFEVDFNYLKTIGMRSVLGMTVDEIAEITSEDKIVITKAAQEKLRMENPIGMRMKFWGKEREVVAVIDDFHNESLKSEIMPSALILTGNHRDFLNIRFESGQTREALSQIEDIWNSMVKDRPFLFQFYDDYYDANYRKETRLGNVFNVFSGIAISISIIGLIGLTTFAAEQRLKEFGIRKVLGASASQLVGLLSKEFVFLILISFLVACPIIYIASADWLDTFKYKITLSPFTFAIGLVITLVVAFASVWHQSRRVSRVNPTEILRNE
ncbi:MULTISPECIES: ABC transporter permease [Roseivirga]|uniref:ABC transporter permease n=1 Tax=Roseivirga TaxID=290180 RepID=UPI00082AC4EB|nr:MULTISPECIES: FtsX-like permease family protein [Roseivirga]MBO6497006.1 ABC transporter permease [Roseivirga sp.]MBO6659411.1 ABC transporter permease [Roseivirga sp.]MBO6907852.1 ABC transporter permease [Roseivirga sp.]WPZ10189.1 FtsX-like permease family protein [Roseivirga spongicola]